MLRKVNVTVHHNSIKLNSINEIIKKDKTEYQNKEIIMELFNTFINQNIPDEFLTTRSYKFIN
jgi:hypothetical protein